MGKTQGKKTRVKVTSSLFAVTAKTDTREFMFRTRRHVDGQMLSMTQKQLEQLLRAVGASVRH